MGYLFNKPQQVFPKAPQAFHILERLTIPGLPYFDQENWRAISFLGREIKLYQPRGLNPVVDQREELPLLPFGNPIGFVPAASRGVTQ